MNIIIPFSLEKDLGKAYNEAMSRIPDDDYAIILDYDAMMLTPNSAPLVDKYVKANPQAALLTAYAARSHKSSSQHYPYNNNGNMLTAIQVAERLERLPMRTRPVIKNVTGFFMVLPKWTWNKYKFREGMGCLGVDTDYWMKLVIAGEQMLLMETIYVWHTYRLKNGIHDKSHLFV